jgi:hypothetical protein
MRDFLLHLALSQNAPTTYYITYDLYSTILTGKDQFRDVIPLPYSDRIMESYKILIHALQRGIKDLIENKLECIVRRVDMIHPKKSYSPPNTMTQQEVSSIISTISDFNMKHPSRIHSNTYKFPINTDLNEMKWYIELERNMTEWKKNKDMEEGY